MNEHYPFKVKPLPYEYNALEPAIDERTLHFHHDKHYAAYVDNLNNALKDYPQLHSMTLEQLLTRLEDLPEEIRTKVKNNGGGVYNHELYFNCMTGSQKECPEMMHLLTEQYDSMEEWKKEMKEIGMTLFGSGWSMLACTKDGSFSIVPLANQDTPLAEGLYPILIVDVWEHAYYLQYQNLRGNYIDEWFSLINWEFVKNRYDNR